MNQTISKIDAKLNSAGLATYSELLSLLREAQRLGLDFDIGNAYIRRTYIDVQTTLNIRIGAARAAAA